MSPIVNIAIEGCCHGDLDRIYSILEESERRNDIQSDFMICCGDFQAIRTEYWKQEKIAKCLTLFVGGNHEAPGHLREMHFGGYAADHIFYLGASGVFNICGLRVAGLSGIFKGRDFDKPIFESPPYSEDTKRSAYHVRRVDIEKLLLIAEPVDIVVTHDWPTGITNFGDTESMLRKKDKTGQLRKELNSGEFGNPYQMEILKKLKPKFWFSGHMHVKYPAIYVHGDGSITRFLALDKCIPHRPFLQLVGVDAKSKDMVQLRQGGRSSHEGVHLDVEWLSILKVNNELLPVGRSGRFQSGSLITPSESDKAEVRELLKAAFAGSDKYRVPYFGQVFPGDDRYRKWFCETLQMRDRMSEADQIEIPTFAPVEAANDALFFLDS